MKFFLTEKLPTDPYELPKYTTMLLHLSRDNLIYLQRLFLLFFLMLYNVVYELKAVRKNIDSGIFGSSQELRAFK